MAPNKLEAGEMAETTLATNKSQRQSHRTTPTTHPYHSPDIGGHRTAGESSGLATATCFGRVTVSHWDTIFLAPERGSGRPCLAMVAADSRSRFPQYNKNE